MKKGRVLSGFISGIFLILIPKSVVPAVDDFQEVSQKAMVSKIYELVVSKDRFVISLDREICELNFIDSWNFRMITSPMSVSFGDSVANMDLTPDGNRLYLAYKDKKIRWIELASLHNLGFNPSQTGLSASSAQSILPGLSADEVGEIMAIQDSDSVSTDCLFVELKDGDTISSVGWVLMSKGTILAQSSTPVIDSVEGLEMAKAQKRLFVKYENAGYSFFSVFRCFSQSLTGKVLMDDLVSNSDEYKGIATNKNGTVLIAGNQTGAEIHPFDIFETIGELIAVPGTPYARLSSLAVDALWLTQFSAENDSLVFISQGDTLSISTLNGDSAEFKDIDPIMVKKFPSSPLVFASSSEDDGYVYISPQVSDTVSIITANPWISSLELESGGTITTETFNLKINVINNSTSKFYYSVNICPNFSISPSDCAREVDEGELTGDTITLKSRDIGEGSYILGVFVRDKSSAPFHQGRNALKVTIDLPPPEQDFSLGFGDEKIFIKFKSPNLNDLDKYLIYYGTNCTADFYKPEEIDDTGGDGDPGSPVVINDPEPNETYEKVVKELVNGQSYCVQIVLIDESGKKSYSKRKSIAPEETKTLTDEVSEKGGFSCSVRGYKNYGSVSSEFILLFFGIFIVCLIKIKLRIKLRRGEWDLRK